MSGAWTTNSPGYYPTEDTPGFWGAVGFGSAHPVGFQMAFCDGSARMMNYSIDLNAHRYLGNRKDGVIIDAKKY